MNQEGEKRQLLVVDDDPQICRFLQRYLSHEGFDVLIARDGAEMRKALSEGTIDLIILDLNMPGDDGLTLTREIRRTSRVGIIILTGKEGSVERVVGLELGADDYVSKPFDERELLARIRSVLRRSAASRAEGGRAAGGTLAFDGFILDIDRRELRRREGTIVALTTLEFDLLVILAWNSQQIMTREKLLEMAAGRDWTPYDRAVDTAVVKLRRKMELNARQPCIIKTVRGVGYVFSSAVTPSS